MRLAAPITDVLHSPEPGRGPAVLCEGLPGDAQEVQGRDRAQDNRGTRSDGRRPESGQEGC